MALAKYVKHEILNIWLWSNAQEHTAKFYQVVCHMTHIAIF